jgi:hypothetical protein
MVIRFTGFSLVVSTNNCNAFEITVIITHELFNLHVKSSQVDFYAIPVVDPYREVTKLNYWCYSANLVIQTHPHRK